MFKLTINADEEMRDLIREEVKGALITLTKEQVKAEVDEGIRRAKGTNNETLEPYIKTTIGSTINSLVRAALSHFNPTTEARNAIQAMIRSDVQRAVALEVEKAMAVVDVPALVRKAFGSITVSTKT